jgi:hypothetical protein
MMMAIRYLMRAALTKEEDQLQPTAQPRVSLRCDGEIEAPLYLIKWPLLWKGFIEQFLNGGHEDDTSVVDDDVNLFILCLCFSRVLCLCLCPCLCLLTSILYVQFIPLGRD